MKPQVTIGVPVHNEERHLERTLDSICRQTYSNLRIIISNNGSTDRSREIMNAYAERDPRFEIHDQKTSLSAVDNVRFLLKQADTPYFMWLGGHDFINDDFVGVCFDQMEKVPYAAIATGRIFWQTEMDGEYSDCNEALNTHHMPPRVALLTWLWNFYSCFQFYGLFRTSVLREVGLPSFYSPDVATIACVLMRGSAVFCGDAVYHATRNRPDESAKAQIRRYAGLGISNSDLEYLERSDARMERFFLPCRKRILKDIKRSNWPLGQKLWTSIEVRRVFKERFDYIIPS